MHTGLYITLAVSCQKGLCFGHDRQQPLEIQEKVNPTTQQLPVNPCGVGQGLGQRVQHTSGKEIAALSASLYAKLKHQPGVPTVVCT